MRSHYERFSDCRYSDRRRREGRYAIANRAGGFSIVELVVVLVVMSILTAIALPQITAVVNASRITGNANEILGGLQLARAEAVRANRRVIFCSSTAGAACNGGSPWPGWAVFNDRNNNNVPDAGELVRFGNIEAPMLAVSTNMPNNRVIFRSDGLAYRNNTNDLLAGTLRVCMPTATPLQNARDIRVAAGGRATINGAVAATIACTPSAN
ncbi:MAG: GspH/FimT family pseudopilin [Xanthomonadaceae bacterium]|nr:GspH/FimT family pseudopilin [Xanthomonadaceae bacterium]